MNQKLCIVEKIALRFLYRIYSEDPRYHVDANEGLRVQYVDKDRESVILHGHSAGTPHSVSNMASSPKGHNPTPSFSIAPPIMAGLDHQNSPRASAGV